MKCANVQYDGTAMTTKKLSESRSHSFKAFSEKIAALIFEEGILFRPYASPSLPYFHMLSDNEQEDVIRDLETFHRICINVKNAGGTLKNTRLMTEIALKEFGYSVKSEDLDLIEPYHLTEIYNLSQLQIFRSFRFFELSSYTLEDLYCRKWYHLYERREEDHVATAEKVTEFLKSPASMKLNFKEHSIREKETLERLHVYSQLHWFIPTYHQDTLSGILVIETARAAL
ncbi:hypothetical protein [Bdellovibrio sp. BCCA]|uniref:hypothetical protein n=1 Tax=Bdellovibrio sp. BCCA TaxID=3136281 RepID=UPI0030F1766E